MPLSKLFGMVAEIMKIHAFTKDWKSLEASYSTKIIRCQGRNETKAAEKRSSVLDRSDAARYI